MTYRFPLQKILDIKTSEKENAQLRVSQALADQERKQTQLAAMEQRLTEFEELVEQKQHQGASVFELRTLADQLQALRKDFVNRTQELQASNKVVAQRQQVLLDAVKDEKTWTLVKETRFEEFKGQMKLKEQAQLDEIASNQFYRVNAIKG